MDKYINNIFNIDCLEFMSKLPNKSIDLIFTDTPYNLGTEYWIDDKGHYRIKGKGSDFANKWKVMDGYWWSDFFKEAFRILKDGGYFVTFNIDRHSDLWSYYGRRNGLVPQQKLYWLFLDNFPKAYDVSKALDRKADCEREVIIANKKENQSNRDNSVLKGLKSDYSITAPCSELGKKYDGYKYSIAPHKQMFEEILVMNKRLENSKSIVEEVLEYERMPRKTLHLPIMKINKPVKDMKVPEKYPPQLFVLKGLNQKVIKSIGIKAATTFNDLVPTIEYTKLDHYYFYKSKIKDRNIVGDTMHVTVKPLLLCERILDLFVLPNKDDMIVYDPFSGSGTIPQACKNRSIKYIGTELDIDYFEIAVKRLNETQQTLF